jgi:hypothetical protein
MRRIILCELFSLFLLVAMMEKRLTVKQVYGWGFGV